MGTLLPDFKGEGQVLGGLLMASYICSCFTMFQIFKRGREQFVFYELALGCCAAFCITLLFEIPPEDNSHEGTRARKIATVVNRNKIMVWLVILQIAIIATNYIDRERQRKQFFIFLGGCFIASFGISLARQLRLMADGILEFSFKNFFIFCILCLMTTFFTILLFTLVNISQKLYLIEKDQTNRYRYMFNSIKDFILVHHGGEVLFKNRTASRVLRHITSKQEEDALSQPWLYVYQDFKEGNSDSSEGLPDRGACLSIQALLDLDFEAVGSLIFTTEKQITAAQSLEKFQAVIEKLGDQDESAPVPLFVQVKLFRVQKEVIEDLWEEGDEVMVQIQDVSHRILGQNLKIERKYLTIMNSTVSHEMRNPLNALLSSVEAQQRQVDELACFLKSKDLEAASSQMLAAFRKSLGVSRSSCKLLKFNVEDILALPQIQQGKFTKNISSIDLGSAVNEVVQIMDFQAREKQIAVTVSYEGFPEESGRCQLRMDEQRFQQILLNYLSNAIKFTKKKGKIQLVLTLIPRGSVYLQDIPTLEDKPGSRINVMKSWGSRSSSQSSEGSEDNRAEGHESIQSIYSSGEEDQLVLAVIDSGVGIKTKDQSKLFKLFGCLKATKQINTKGIGLGLAISKMIAEEFGGRAAVESRFRQGSAFYASLEVNNDRAATASVLELRDDSLETKLKEIRSNQLLKAREMLEEYQMTKKEPADGKRVLIIDDEAYNLEVLAVILESVELPRSRFDLCMSGEEALLKVKENSSPVGCDYAVVLTDLSMPFIDGFKFTCKMRRLLEKDFGLHRGSQPLVAAVTGHTENEIFSQAFESQIDQVYCKPLTREWIQLLLTEAGFMIKLEANLLNRIK